MPTIRIDLIAQGYPVSITDTTESYHDQQGEPTLDAVQLIMWHVEQIKEAGFTPAFVVPAQGTGNAPRAAAAGSAYPEDLPAELREDWDKIIPIGERTKGQPLGPAGRKEWSFFAEKSSMQDMKAAAKRLLKWEIDRA